LQCGFWRVFINQARVFQEVGGFDEQLSGALADVDLCLKMRRAGYLMFTLHSQSFIHHESGAGEDRHHSTNHAAALAAVLERDPYYNPNLLATRDFSLGN